MSKNAAEVKTGMVKMTATEEMRQTLTKMSAEFRAALPPQIPVERFIRTTITAIQMSPQLLECDRRSVLGASMRAAQDGLLPDGREAAFLIFRSKSGPICQYLPMVGGLLKKIRNSGELASIAAHAVYENDRFEYALGDEEKIVHVPLLSGERGDVIAAYAIARTKDGAIYREVMTRTEIDKVRASSKAKDAGPWVDWFAEMARKTVIRRIAKRLPSSADLEQALEHDNEVVGFVQAPVAPAEEPRGSRPKVLQKIVESTGEVVDEPGQDIDENQDIPV